MDEFVTYVLYSKKYQKIYIGYTSNLIVRFKSHNCLSKKGFTTKFRPWIIIHVEFFNSKSLAMSREKELKSSKGRFYIKEEILNHFML